MPVFLLLVAAMSLLAYALYAVDKRRARAGRYRIRESVLLSVGFFGGALGALLAMQRLRHKTRHTYFYLVNLLGLLWQTALVILLVLYG